MSVAERILADALALTETKREALAARLLDSLDDRADRDTVANRLAEPLVSLDKAMSELGISRADVPR